MTYTFWSSNTGGDGPTPGPPGGTGNSLRFRGTQYLQRDTVDTTTGSTSGTFSVWYKRGYKEDTGLRTIFNASYNGGSQLNPSTNGVNFRVPTNSTGFASLGGQLRDPSAWYHVVCSYDSTTTKLWINGELSGTCPTSADNVLRLNTNCFIGTAGNVQFFEGYLSDFYVIEGQVLEPTAFAHYNEDGVWVPREVDFTPAQMRYSDMLTCTQGFDNDYPRTNAFDGSTSTRATTGFAGDGIDFQPVEPITFTNTLRVWGGVSAGPTLRLNGGSEIALNASGWTDIVSSGGGTIERIIINGNTHTAQLSAIEVDGQILTDPYLWSSGCQATVGTENSGAPFTRLFDGNLDTITGYMQMNEPNSRMQWIPPNDIYINKKLEWYFYPGNSNEWQISVDGVVSTGSVSSASNWTTLFTGSGKLDYVVIMNSYCTAMGVAVDGQTLLDGVNNSYGVNGFHLTFQDPDNLGLDSSGNNNHFTANNFNTDVIYNGDYNWTSIYVDSNTNTIPTVLGGDPYWIDLVPAPSEGDTWCRSGSQMGWSNGKITGTGNSDSTYLYGSGQLSQNELTFDLRDFDTVYSAAIWAGWNQSDGSTSSAVVSLLDENKNIIPGTSVNPVRVGNFSQREEMCNTDVGARYIKFDLSAPGSYFMLWGIEINGGLLTQNVTNPDYDLMQDGPSQNYTTGNPVDAIVTSTPSFNYNSANLKGTGLQNGLYFGISSARIELNDTNNYYWEIITTLANDATYPNLVLYQTWGNGWTDQVFMWIRDGTSYFNGISTPGALPSWNVNDVCGIRFDGSTNTVYCSVNGGAESSFVLPERIRPLAPGYLCPPQNNTFVALNFGQKPFLYQPEGSVALQTENYPGATIADGREHFQAITGPGNGTGIYTTTANIAVDGPFDASTWTYRGTTPFSVQDANFVIDLGGEVTTTNFTYSSSSGSIRVLLSIDGITWRQIGTDAGWTTVGTMTWSDGNPFRYVRHWFNGGNSGYTLGLSATTSGVPILQAAQATFPNGLWWIKDRFNNGHHQIGDSARGGDFVQFCPDTATETSYSPPPGESVAWCWKAGDTGVTDNNGSLESTVYVNHEAGFSMVEWVGNGGFESVGHGLNARPSLIITKPRNAIGNWCVGVDGLTVLTGGGSPSQWLTYNSFITTNWGNALLLNSDSLYQGLQASEGINVSGATMRAYCWRNVPGFSSIGIYNGNSNTDGPFIYTGFRPAFVLIKRATANGNWHLYDTTRGVTNPTGPTLYPDLTFAEQDVDYLDILSNGFKLRTDQGPVNLGSVYVYACFAENPFGGSNVSPANAR